MRDKHGVLRGSCSECDCKDFEPPTSGPYCDYCAHTAPQHRSLKLLSLSRGETTAASSSASSLENSNIHSVNNPWVVNIPHASDVPSTSFAPTNGQIVFDFVEASQGSSGSSELMPADEDLNDGIDDSLLTSLNKGSVTAEQERQLIRDVAKHLKKKKKDKPKYLRRAAIKIQKKWNCVGSTADRDQVGLHMQLRRRMEKLRSKSKRDQNKENIVPPQEAAHGEELFDTPLSSMTHVEKCVKLKSLWEAGDHTLISTLMTATRDARVLECQVRNATDVLAVYPCLREKDYLLSEFATTVNVTLATLNKNWDNNITKLIDLMQKENFVKIPEIATADQKAIIVLNGLSKLFAKQKHSLLKIYEENTTVNATRPKGRVVGTRIPPQLIVIGNPLSCPVSFHAFLDSEIMFAVQEPKQAVQLLLALYFIFHVKWCSKTRLQQLLLTAIFIDIELVRKEVTSNAELRSILKRLGLRV